VPRKEYDNKYIAFDSGLKCRWQNLDLQGTGKMFAQAQLRIIGDNF
jgi:hypothetical protein